MFQSGKLFQSITNTKFPILPNEVIADFSPDEHYTYRICLTIVVGELDADLGMLEVGPIVHSRWLTLGYRIL